MSAEERARRLLEEAFRLSEEGRVLAAIQVCQQAVAINPSSTSAHSLLGTLYERQGDRESAIRAYEQVLTLSPGSTVERRRLNELMGVPAAREAAGISPHTARLAVTGGALVVVVVLAAAILLSLRPAPELARRAGAAETAARPSLDEEGLAGPSDLVPNPGGWYTSPRVYAPRAPVAPRMAPQGPAGIPGSGASGYLAPGTYLVPSTGGPRPAAPPRQPAAPVAPFAGAVLMAPGEQPAVRTPLPATAGAQPVAQPSPQVARRYYFQGSRQQAIQVYESYLQLNPQAGAAPREELAWVHLESGNRQRAAEYYRQARDRYQEDIHRGHNVEAARHGLRTSEAALRALEVQ